MPLRSIARITVAASLAAMAAYLWFVAWAPENQVRRHQQRFVEALAENRYGTYSEMISTTYLDGWGLDRENFLRGASEMARQFFQLRAEWTESSLNAADRSGTTSGAIQLAGKGNAIGQEIISRVNRLDSPFTFEWRRETWKPWAWKLSAIRNPELRIPEGLDFGSDWGF